jgi:hypothetical protein
MRKSHMSAEKVIDMFLIERVAKPIEAVTDEKK